MWNQLKAGIDGWWSRHKGRLVTWSIGLLFNSTVDFLFDHVAYGLVVGWAVMTWGPSMGALVAFAIMGPLSALLSWLHFPVYDYLKRDWFAIEALKSVRDEQAETNGFLGGLRKVSRRILQWGNIPALIYLSIWQGPFFATAYLREGVATYNGLSKRDWRNFWVSTIIGNGYWTLRWGFLWVVADWILFQFGTSVATIAQKLCNNTGLC